MGLSEGKIHHSLLKEITKLSGYKHGSVVQGPVSGFDVSSLDLSTVFTEMGYESPPLLVYKSDPITFPTANPGRQLVIVNQNDLATAGARAYAMTVTIMMPTGFPESRLLEIQRGLHEAALEEEIVIIGGHTEVTSQVKGLVLVGSFIGFLQEEKYIGVEPEPGDSIIFSGWVGAEGTGIILSEGGNVVEKFLDASMIEDGRNIGEEISIRKRILRCNELHHEGIKMVHDVTEGGFRAAVYECLEPLGRGVEVYSEHLPVAPVTEKLANMLGFDPLYLIGSGAFLLFADEEYVEDILEELRGFDQPASIVGRVTDSKDIRLDEEVLSVQKGDALISALQKLNELGKK
ncbi:hypothetical protein GF326_00450 [Candidatus Bathyarchaeota archaeon]|nr:hypothetical protein [Candidatus Bathyarchaeota archaeon]